MLVKREAERKLRGEDIPPSEITDPGIYLNRRAFMTGVAALALAPWGGMAQAQGNLQPLQATKNPAYQLPDSLTSYKNITTTTTSTNSARTRAIRPRMRARSRPGRG